MQKCKLDLDQQIDHMELRGIRFNEISKADAKEFLSKSTYYFKLKAFAKNYPKYQHGDNKDKYVNLEFAYLKELSILDMHLRKLISSMTSDIEHYLKVRLLNDIAQNSQEDGYSIVQLFFNANKRIADSIVTKCAPSATSDLVKRYCCDWAAWNVIEVLSFGDFVRLYTYYYGMYANLYDQKETYSNVLGSIRFLRNAAAHNNCLLNSMVNPYLGGRCSELYCRIDKRSTAQKNKPFKMTKKLSFVISSIQADIGLSNSGRKRLLKNPVIHDLAALIYLYSSICPGSAVSATKDNLDRFIERCQRHSKYFADNQNLQSAYDFFKKTVDYYFKIGDNNCVEQKEQSF